MQIKIILFAAILIAIVFLNETAGGVFATRQKETEQRAFELLERAKNLSGIC